MAQEKPTEKKKYPLWDGKEAVAEYAKRVKLDPAITLDLGDGVKMELVLIPAGKFVMGSPKDDQSIDDYNEGPQHEVTIGKPFYMGKFEVTQEQYEKFIKENPSRFKGARNPVEEVSWDTAQEFCKKLSEKVGRTIRLPSEAEWEYACRAGSTTPIYPTKEQVKMNPLTDEKRRRVAELIPMLGSDEVEVRDKATRELIAMGKGVLPILDGIKTEDLEVQGRLAAVRSAFQPSTYLGGVAWYSENSDGKTHPVGEKEPNVFGLHDMIGNVCEWVEDDWHVNYDGAPSGGQAWIENPRGIERVARGGSWYGIARLCNSAIRFRDDHMGMNTFVGFRVMSTLSGAQ
jgi:formylglycine-generating enzyme required for sulfatase activity